MFRSPVIFGEEVTFKDKVHFGEAMFEHSIHFHSNHIALALTAKMALPNTRIHVDHHALVAFYSRKMGINSLKFN
jgi:hypothetical protein